MTSSLHSSWRNPRIWLLLTMVFVCGAASGALFYRLASQKVSAKPPVVEWKPANKERTLQRLQTELQLTPQQSAEIETVLDDFALYYQMLQKQMDESMSMGRQRIDHVLSDPQRKKFSKIMEELKRQETR